MSVGSDLGLVLAHLLDLWKSHRSGQLRDYIMALGYNEAGRVCARLRAMGEKDLAELVEELRIR